MMQSCGFTNFKEWTRCALIRVLGSCETSLGEERHLKKAILSPVINTSISSNRVVYFFFFPECVLLVSSRSCYVVSEEQFYFQFNHRKGPRFTV